VGDDLFEAVQEQLAENKRRRREQVRASYCLQGLVECAFCGYAYYGKRTSRASAKGKVPYAYYRCIGSDAHRFGGQRVCDNRQVRSDLLDEAVWSDVCEVLRQPDALKQEFERRLAPTVGETPAATELAAQLRGAERAVTRLIDAYQDGLLT
jgi:site-specific DNA recombinase